MKQISIFLAVLVETDGLPIKFEWTEFCYTVHKVSLQFQKFITIYCKWKDR